MMHTVWTLLVIDALLISLLVRLIMTKPTTLAQKSVLHCQYCPIH